MIESQWDEIKAELTGLWGAGNAQITERRLDVWAKRFRNERHAVVVAAIKKLERICKHWPSIADMHGAIDEVQSRFGHGRPAGIAQRQPDAPVTNASMIEMAERLVHAAGERVRSGRGVDGDPWHRYLLDLAAFYEINAERHRRGDSLTWPPPAASGAMAGALGRVFRDTGRDDAADRAERRRAHEAFVDDGREG